jgi:hypothetical protein
VKDGLGLREKIHARDDETVVNMGHPDGFGLRLREKPHVSDDETVANMGHPGVYRFCGGYLSFSLKTR